MRYGMKNDEKTVHRVMKRIVETCPPQLITLHPRSKEQRYTKLADWDYVPECVNALSGKVPLWVCGDVFSHQDYYNVASSLSITLIDRFCLASEYKRHWWHNDWTRGPD